LIPAGILDPFVTARERFSLAPEWAEGKHILRIPDPAHSPLWERFDASVPYSEFKLETRDVERRMYRSSLCGDVICYHMPEDEHRALAAMRFAEVGIAIVQWCARMGGRK
jgi:hypothetical protein